VENNLQVVFLHRAFDFPGYMGMYNCFLINL
jgi:hypothetical protein